MTAVMQNGEALQYASNYLKNDINLALMALKQNKKAIK